MTFGDVLINTPNNSVDYLTQRYGPNWKTHTKKYNHLFGLQDWEEKSITEEEKQLALEDFRRETAILRRLRHVSKQNQRTRGGECSCV